MAGNCKRHRASPKYQLVKSSPQECNTNTVRGFAQQMAQHSQGWGIASIYAWLMDGLYVQVCVCCDKTVSGAMFSSDNCRNYFSIWTSFSISIKILLVNEKTSRVYTPCCINQCKAKDCKDLLLSGCGSVLAALRPCHTPTRGASTILIVPWCRLPYTEDNHIKIRSIIHFNVLPNK